VSCSAGRSADAQWPRWPAPKKTLSVRDAEAIAEALQRPMMKFAATKTADQLDLLALHRVRNGWSGSAPASSIRFVPSCWNAALRYARVYAVFGANYHSSLPTALTRSYHA
jgi:hypothetical protein